MVKVSNKTIEKLAIGFFAVGLIGAGAVLLTPVPPLGIILILAGLPLIASVIGIKGVDL